VMTKGGGVCRWTVGGGDHIHIQCVNAADLPKTLSAFVTARGECLTVDMDR